MVPASRFELDQTVLQTVVLPLTLHWHNGTDAERRTRPVRLTISVHLRSTPGRTRTLTPGLEHRRAILYATGAWCARHGIEPAQVE